MDRRGLAGLLLIALNLWFIAAGCAGQCLPHGSAFANTIDHLCAEKSQRVRRDDHRGWVAHPAARPLLPGAPAPQNSDKAVTQSVDKDLQRTVFLKEKDEKLPPPPS